MAVPGERLATDKGATAEAGGVSSPLFAGNDEILGWLDILLKGKPEQQALARTEIAMILEAKGFADDAEEAYWANVQGRAADRRSYERLIALYQLRRDRLSETLVRRQLDEVFGQPEPTRPATPDDRRSTSASARSTTPRESNGAPVSIARQLTSPSNPSPPVRRLRGSRRAAEPSSPTQPSSPGRSTPDDAHDSSADRVVRCLPTPSASGPGVSASPTRHTDGTPQRALASAGPQAVQVSEVVLPMSSQGMAGGRRRAALLPNPAPSSRRYRSPSGGLVALQPTTIFAFLLASFGVAALIAFLLISSDRGSGARMAISGANQVPARCADASLRFPGANDPRGAVASAYRQQGVDVEAPRPGGPRLTVDQAEQVVGGWMAASLLLEHAGQPAPKLNEWLDAESPRPTLANAIMAGRHLDTMLTPDEWTEIRSWPATSCEGAFVRDPRNAGHVRLMERVVAK